VPPLGMPIVAMLQGLGGELGLGIPGQVRNVVQIASPAGLFMHLAGLFAIFREPRTAGGPLSRVLVET
jgi:hypothetical protein